jgi:energy-converting hydrogenase Eha subunit F
VGVGLVSSPGGLSDTLSIYGDFQSVVVRANPLSVAFAIFFCVVNSSHHRRTGPGDYPIIARSNHLEI